MDGDRCMWSAPGPAEVASRQKAIVVGANDSYNPMRVRILEDANVLAIYNGTKRAPCTPSLAGVDSHSPSPHSSEVAQTTLAMAVALSAMCSLSAQLLCAMHSVLLCGCSGW